MPVKVSYNIDLGPELPNDVQDIAREQGEDPDRVCALIQELREMLYERGTPSTPLRTDDEFLIRFLRSRFWKVDLAYKLFCNYCEFRESNPELHVDVHPFMLSKLGDDDIVSVTPYRDEGHRRILIYRFGNWRPSKIPIDDIFRASLILLEMGTMEPISQVVGGVGIFDLEGLSLNHIWYVTPSVVKRILAMMVTSLPLRVNAIHIVNNNWAFDMAFQLFKPFLSDRMRERLFIHGSDMTSLHKHIGKSHLPAKYGGDMPEFPYTDWMRSLSKNQKVMEDLKQLGYEFDQEEFSSFI